jgi:hypothetical protein
MKMDGKFCLVSKDEPAAQHDKERLEQYQRMTIDNLAEKESIVMDKGFAGLVPEQPKGQWLIMKSAQNMASSQKMKEEETRKSIWFNVLLRGNWVTSVLVLQYSVSSIVMIGNCLLPWFILMLQSII